MIYLKNLARRGTLTDAGYPCCLPLLQGFAPLSFTCPVTIFCGDNGCGKTTLLDLIAEKTHAVRVDGQAGGKAAQRQAISCAARRFTASMTAHPRTALYFSAEDFVRYGDQLDQMQEENRRDLMQAQLDNAHRSPFALAQATMAYAGQLSQMAGMYETPLGECSHGEKFLAFFGSRLVPGGLYLLDEPEAALSYPNQYVLMHMLADAVRADCQILLSTHSPILLAYPDAQLCEIVDGQMQETVFSRLRSVEFLRSFLQAPERYTRTL